MDNSIASLDQALGTAAKLHRLLREAGLPDEALQWPIDDPAMRRGLVDYWRGYYTEQSESGAPQPILRLISGGGEPLVLDETDGAQTIPASEGVFDYIDGDFRSYGADEASGPTSRTPVAVHELIRDATFSQMFSANPGALCLTQSQILGFVRKYRNWLRIGGYGTLFLFRSRGELFVARISFLGREGLCAYVSRFEDGYVWRAVSRHRFVLPQL